MAKQSWKQQMYQSIANSQVQQVMQQQRDQGIAQLQAEFDAWQKQQNDIAQLQAEYDSWYAQNNPQPVQSAPVQTVKAAPKQEAKQESIPSLADFFKPTTASGKDINKEAVAKLSEDEARLEEQRAKRKEAAKDTLNMFNTNEFKDAVKKGEAQRIADKKEKASKTIGGSINQLDLGKYNLPSDSGITEQEQKSFDDYTKALEWSDPNYRMTKEEQKEARRIASEGKQALAEKYPVENKADFGKLYERMSPEDQERYRTYDNLSLKSDPVSVASVGAADKAVNMLGGALNTLAFFHPGAIPAARDYKELQKKWNEGMEETETEAIAKSATPLAENVPLIGEITPYGVGQAATQLGAYALTNSAFDEAGAALLGDKLGKLGGFIGNQIGQNAQDIALDTIPRYQELKAQGKSDEEIRDTLIEEGLWNVGGNLGLGLLGEIPGLWKSAKANSAAKRAADEAFRQNVRGGVENLSKIANEIPRVEDIDNITRNTVRQIEDSENVVRNAARQAEEATQNIENIARQMPEIPENVPVRPGTAAPVSPAIENEAEAMAKAMDAEEAAKAVETPTIKTEIDDMSEVVTNRIYDVGYKVDAANDEALSKSYNELLGYEEKWAKAISNSTDIAEIKQATKDLSNAISRFNTKAKKVDPSIAKDIYNKKFNSMLSGFNTKLDDFYNGARRSNEAADIILKEEAAKIGNNSNVPGAEPLQTFADGQNAGQWKTSKARTNTIEKLGWGDQMPEKDFAYKVYSEAEQNADAVARYKDSQDVVADILNKNYEDYDELDVKMAYNEAQRLLDQGDQQSVAQAQRLMTKNAAAQRQSGRVVQASAEFTRNTAAGALGDAVKMEEDKIINPWKSKNQKAVAGNSRIAKALAEMGHKTEVKTKPVLTHDQIKEGVIKELNREVGSVEQYFNDSDIEFLTRLAEDKSVPVWQITSEIEHKLNTGSWYTLDEAIDIPKPTNQKLQNALNSLVTETVRTEKAAPSLAQITEEVRNTLSKESAELGGMFTDEDVEYLANLINSGATKQELADALDHKLATGSFGISAETMNQVNSIFKEISKFDPNSKQFVEGQAEAYRLLANEVVGDATALEKFEAWRYLAMLGNPKTMLRNFIGNQTFGVVTGISNNLAAMAEAGIDRASKALGGEGIQRTKSVLNPVKDSDLIKAAAEDADVSRYRQIIGSKYEKMDADTLRQSKSVFNSKVLQLYERVTDAGISDYKAVKNKFSTSLAGYLKANGYGTDIFKAEDELARLKNLGESRLLSNAEKDTVERLTKDVAELEKARDFALKQAEYATFHEDNAVADALSRASRYLRTSDNKVLNAGGAMLEGIVPFKKTPANVLRSGLEYSPLGAIKSIKKTGKLIYENTGVRKGNLADTYINKKGKEVAKTLASDVIDSWSKTLTGSGLTALGFYLFDKGILNSSDKDLQYQDQLEGKQNYSLTINGKTYTIDWAAPTAMPLLLGAEVAKVWRDSGNDVENWYEHLDEYLNAANRLADPLIETSMLQGIKDTLETAANAAKYDENLNIPTLIGYNALTGYLTQGIPTVGGQIARTIDPTRRSTYTDKEGVAGTLEKQGRKLMNKVPGLSMLNQPYIDTYGREQQNSPFDNPLANLGYQMFSPGYLADINTTDADTMSRDVYEKSGKADNILPKWYSYFKDTEGKRVSPEDFTKASRVAGDIQQTVRNELANDEWFNGLSDADKAEIVDDINTLASNVAKSSIDSEFTSSSKPYNAYKEGGLKGLMDHFKNRYASDVAQESGLNSSTKAAQAIKEDVMKGDTESANEKIEASLSLQDLGLTKPSPTYTYYNAQTVIPGLTTEDFAKTYKAIDSDGNQGIKQNEVIAYLNSKKITSESEAKKIWSAYGSSEWKSIPKLENGKWVKKKK